MQTVIFYDSKKYEQDYFENELVDKFHLVFKENELTPSSLLNQEEENAEIISVFTGSRLTAETLYKFKNLKLILTRSVGYSHIDMDYCNENHIIVVNTPHYGDYTVAEFTFGLLLNLVRKISCAENQLKNGDMYPETFGMELFSKTIGIVGTGSIGEKVAKIARGFSMNILYFDVKRNIYLEESLGLKYVDLDTLCKLSDVITLHAPLNPHTYHLIDANRIALMSESTVIVNTARGELIDTEALYDALLDKKIKGAALDVLEFEDTISSKRPGADLNLKNLRTSLINNKLLHLSNVVATPHIAYDTKEAVTRILEMSAHSLKSYYANEEIKNKL